MDKFEFEINEQLNSTKSSGADTDSQTEEKAINFSAAITQALQEKRKAYNSSSNLKISLSQLKEVYRKSARQFNEEKHPNHNRGCWAMARVNMFTRILSKEDLPVLEVLKICTEASKEWMPCSEDFFLAQAEIKKHKLNYNFKDVDELYLEDYKPIDFEWR